MRRPGWAARSGLAGGLAWGLAAALGAGVGAFGLGACDPLTEGGWKGTPTMVVRGTLQTFTPSRDGEALGLALVWTPLGAPVEAPTMLVEKVRVERHADLGAFELEVRDPPTKEVLTGATPAAVALFAVVDLSEVKGLAVAAGVGAASLRELVHAVSSEHYLIYVKDAGAARVALAPYLLNPIALESGFNLAAGVCRPGRPSQFLIVSPEQIAVAEPAEARDGECLDVFWGAWRGP